MNLAPVPASSPVDNLKLARLEEVLAILADSLVTLDELGLGGASLHVSLGYDIGRVLLEKVRNGEIVAGWQETSVR